MKDINLLPEDILAANADPKKESKEQTAEPSKDLDLSIERVANYYEKSKGFVLNVSKNIKENLRYSVQNNSELISDMIHNLKKVKLRQLEILLKIDKKEMINATKKSFIYSNESGRIYIIDKDMWGEPVSVTIKERQNVTTKCVKFLGDQPFLYPMFNEKNINGEIVNLTENEIWYLNKLDATIIIFKNNTPTFLQIDQKDMPKTTIKEDLIKHLEIVKMLYQNETLNNLLLIEKKFQKEFIFEIHATYVIYNESNQYRVLLLDEFTQVTDEFLLKKLPPISRKGRELLFSKEIYNYVIENKYSFENFTESSDHLEYWQQIGQNRACVLRLQI
jgi:hypothetical protein